MRWHLIALLALTLRTVPASAQSTPASNVYVFPLFVDGVSGDLRYRSTLTIRNLEANPLRCTLTQRNTSAPFAGLDGIVYSADIFDGGFSPSAITEVLLDRFLPWEILRTNAQSSLKVGYASLSCPGRVDTQLLLSLADAQNHKVGETTVMSATAGSSFEFLIDRRDGTRFGFSLANVSSAFGQFALIARDRFNYEVDRAYDTIEPWSQVSRFVDEMLALPPDFVGNIEVVSLAGGTAYTIGLQLTGSVFTTIQPLIRSAPLTASVGGTK
jgi:hypothetical protein